VSSRSANSVEAFLRWREAEPDRPAGLRRGDGTGQPGHGPPPARGHPDIAIRTTLVDQVAADPRRRWSVRRATRSSRCVTPARSRACTSFRGLAARPPGGCRWTARAHDPLGAGAQESVPACRRSLRPTRHRETSAAPALVRLHDLLPRDRAGPPGWAADCISAERLARHLVAQARPQLVTSASSSGAEGRWRSD